MLPLSLACAMCSFQESGEIGVLDGRKRNAATSRDVFSFLRQKDTFAVGETSDVKEGKVIKHSLLFTGFKLCEYNERTEIIFRACFCSYTLFLMGSNRKPSSKSLLQK